MFCCRDCSRLFLYGCSYFNGMIDEVEIWYADLRSIGGFPRGTCANCMTPARALSIRCTAVCCCVNFALHCVKALAMCTKAHAICARGGVSLCFASNERLLGLRAVLFTLPVYFPMSRVLAGGGSVAGAMMFCMLVVVS